MSEWIVFSLHLEREGGRDIGQIRENQASVKLSMICGSIKPIQRQIKDRLYVTLELHRKMLRGGGVGRLFWRSTRAGRDTFFVFLQYPRKCRMRRPH